MATKPDAPASEPSPDHVIVLTKKDLLKNPALLDALNDALFGDDDVSREGSETLQRFAKKQEN